MMLIMWLLFEKGSVGRQVDKRKLEMRAIETDYKPQAIEVID